MIGSIPFKIPAEYMSGLLDGSLVRIGTVLKDTASGKIVAHIQETGVAQQVLSDFTKMPFSSLDSVLSLASSGYANVQLKQLTSMVEGLQVLQYANLGVSIAGIGVSVIGFVVINKRLKSIEGQMTHLAAKMDFYFRELFERELRKHYSQIYVLFEKADFAHKLSNSTREWQNVASQLADESGFFKGEIAHLLSQDKFEKELFISLVRSLALCNSGRIECLLLANELPAAQRATEVIGQNYKELFDPLTPIQLTRKNSNNRYYRTCDHEHSEITTLIQGIRDITDAALTKPFLLERLMEKKISGHDYISAVREEKEHPLVLLRDDAYYR